MSNFVRSSSVDRCAIFSGILAIAAFILLFPGNHITRHAKRLLHAMNDDGRPEAVRGS